MELLSDFAFNCNLRHYNMDKGQGGGALGALRKVLKVGRCRFITML